jgi:hypothetical protein
MGAFETELGFSPTEYYIIKSLKGTPLSSG